MSIGQIAHGFFRLQRQVSASLCGISPVAYRIELPQTMKIHNVFHVDLLIPHRQTEAYGETYHQPPPELIDGEEEYKIEEIIDQRTDKQRQKKQYLVSWAGYPASENS